MIKKNVKKGINYLKAFYNFFRFCINDIKKIKHAQIVFVLPYFQTGGAERVHLNIIKSVKDKSLCVIFTHNSATDNFKKDFSEYAQIIEINKILNKKSNTITRALKVHIGKTINKSQSIKSIFGSNTNFFYELLPQLKEEIVKIDLIHAISKENPTIESHYVNSSSSINHRIVINKKAYGDVLLIYKNNQVNECLIDRVVVIENAIEIKENDTFKERDSLKIGFVGRWSKEKRPDIFLKIAKAVKKHNPQIDFEMVGIGMKSNVKKINQFGVSFLGEITDDDALSRLYKSLTFVLITSSREGFPMVIIEAMAHGVIPITTNVGGISEHLTSFENSILIENSNNEDDVAKLFVDAILELINNKVLISNLSLNAFNYSRKHFSITDFNKAYRHYLLQEKY
ncbi:glycosyltransferase family 4 protein [Sabulilitoribacter arenilitoris]|uniref:Glycosyltransferase family 4 protein n=1 Tax=Wocania arenilitoris TaxID=2044858 RepID=A0AAE3JM35_9FLAO|nr:glycosyltransferase family 4 protein [Wocania arenilitoris]MCF7568959.1 glycosyltransferase family 4 protein [Wocania arenilitoris]